MKLLFAVAFCFWLDALINTQTTNSKWIIRWKQHVYRWVEIFM